MSQMRFSRVVLSVDAEDNQTILHENVDLREEKINFGINETAIFANGAERGKYFVIEGDNFRTLNTLRRLQRICFGRSRSGSLFSS